ncbi:MAG TPA: hypothetical protein VFZ70_00240 [Euzebyales bacterium]
MSTAVAVAAEDGTFEICAPLGVGDRLDGVWRRNRAAQHRTSTAGLERKRPAERWPGVRVAG